METNNLLVELLVEELPPKALKKLGEAFAAGIADGLKAQGLAAADAVVTAYATPRRLAVHVANVAAQAPDQRLTRKLMPVKVGFGPDGKATAALRKNLAKLGRESLADAWPNGLEGPDSLFVQNDGKADVIFVSTLARGSSLQVGLQNAIDETLTKLPIPKVMSYQLADGWSSVHFVRPAHGLVALHGAAVVPVSALGLQAGRSTRGHRFMSAGPIDVDHADSYARALREQGKVIAAFAERRQIVEDQLSRLRVSAESDGVIAPDALLDEVTALVEWPVVYECHFDDAFLQVPQECLILTMQTNQKYFACTRGAALVNRFLVVSNIETDDASAIVQGNERVVRPRLADAKFFFDQDRKKSLESRVPALAKVVYHAKLGSMGERVERVRALARAIGAQLGGDALAQAAERAAVLAKADLLSDMVGEFPELQGIMGGYYARHDGESEDVACAVEDHYKPRFAGDELPRQLCGVALALADKLETLAGLFGIGQLPSGDKDPFALRRHALGVIRMLIERALPLDAEALILQAFQVFGPQHGQAQAELALFLRERLVGYLREQGYSALEVEAVLELRPARWAEIPQRLAAVQAFARLPEAVPLAAANKRVGNILKKSEAGAMAELDVGLLKEPAERALSEALVAVELKARPAFEARDYTGSLQSLAALKAPVDAFFDQVMVNADDPALRTNRLALLTQLHAAMNRVADLSRLAA